MGVFFGQVISPLHPDQKSQEYKGGKVGQVGVGSQSVKGHSIELPQTSSGQLTKSFCDQPEIRWCFLDMLRPNCLPTFHPRVCVQFLWLRPSPDIRHLLLKVLILMGPAWVRV